MRLGLRSARGRRCSFAMLTFSTTTLPLARAGLEDLPALPAVLAGDHLDGVAFSDLQSRAMSKTTAHSTSGARLTIFMKFFSRSSRATGPKMRVPRGLQLVVDDHGRVLVEGDGGTVVAGERLPRPHDDGPDDLALLHGALRRRHLDRAHDDVADPRVAAMRAAEHADAQELASSRCCPQPAAGTPAGSSGVTSPPRGSRRGARTSSSRATAGLDDADDVADLGRVLLVVRVELLRPPHDLLVDGMGPGGLDAYDDRLVHRARRRPRRDAPSACDRSPYPASAGG